MYYILYLFTRSLTVDTLCFRPACRRHFAITFYAMLSPLKCRFPLAFLFRIWICFGAFPMGSNCKKPPKTRLDIFVKLTDHLYARSSLTNFGYKLNATTGTGNCANLLKLGWKQFVLSLQINLLNDGAKRNRLLYL